MSAASGSEPPITRGRVETAVAAEFPGLELRWCAAAGRPRRSPPAVRERLRALSDRYLGARVVAMRTQPIAHAYRAFFRHTGLDPDVTPVPSEASPLQRLRQRGQEDVAKGWFCGSWVDDPHLPWVLNRCRVRRPWRLVRKRRVLASRHRAHCNCRFPRRLPLGLELALVHSPGHRLVVHPLVTQQSGRRPQKGRSGGEFRSGACDGITLRHRDR